MDTIPHPLTPGRDEITPRSTAVLIADANGPDRRWALRARETLVRAGIAPGNAIEKRAVKLRVMPLKRLSQAFFRYQKVTKRLEWSLKTWQANEKNAGCKVAEWPAFQIALENATLLQICAGELSRRLIPSPKTLANREAENRRKINRAVQKS